MRRLWTFFLMLRLVLVMQSTRRMHVGDRLLTRALTMRLQSLFGDQPMPADVSGDIEPRPTSAPYGPDRNVPVHLLKCRKGIKQW